MDYKKGETEGIMSITNDGGPAFPVPSTTYPSGQVECGTIGMSLLDWFAGNAMQMQAAWALESVKNGRGVPTSAELASKAYDWAEDMIAERERRRRDGQ